MRLKIYVIDFEIPRPVKKWGLRVGIPLAVLLGGGAIAWAGLKTWSAGDPLLAADLNANFTYLQSATPTVTAWTAYTPSVTSSSTGATISNLTTTGAWRRVGDTIEVRILTSATGVPSGPTGEFWLWGLPGSPVDSVDFTKIPKGSILGSASAYVTSSVECEVVAYGSGLEVGCQGSGFSGQSGVPFPWASGASLGIVASYPVAGWSVH